MESSSLDQRLLNDERGRCLGNFAPAMQILDRRPYCLPSGPPLGDRSGGPREDMGLVDNKEPGLGRVPLEELRAGLQGTHEVEREWRSRTASLTLYRSVQSGSAQSLLVKQAEGWDAPMAEYAYTTLRSLRSHAHSKGHPHFVPRPFSWGRLPAYVCFEWVQGTLLADLISENLEGSPARFHTWVSDTGKALGRVLSCYHSTFLASAPPGVVSTNSLEGGAARIARFVSGDGGTLGLPVRSLGDGGPHNVIVDDDGQIWLIDLPAGHDTATAQWDIARLALRLVRTAERAMGKGWLPDTELQRDLLAAIVAGYEANVSIGATSPESRSLIHAYQVSEALVRLLNSLKNLPPRLQEAFREAWRGSSSAIDARSGQLPHLAEAAGDPS